VAQFEKKNRILTYLLIVMIGQVGCLTVIIAVASVLLGLWLDNYFNTKPVITLILLFAGIPLSVLLMLYVGRRTLAQLKEKSGDEILS